MSTFRLIVVGLVLLVGLLPAGSGGAASYELAARLTGDSLERVTPSVSQPVQVEEAVSLPGGVSTDWWPTGGGSAW